MNGMNTKRMIVIIGALLALCLLATTVSAQIPTVRTVISSTGRMWANVDTTAVGTTITLTITGTNLPVQTRGAPPGADPDVYLSTNGAVPATFPATSVYTCLDGRNAILEMVGLDLAATVGRNAITFSNAFGAQSRPIIFTVRNPAPAFTQLYSANGFTYGPINTNTGTVGAPAFGFPITRIPRGSGNVNIVAAFAAPGMCVAPIVGGDPGSVLMVGRVPPMVYTAAVAAAAPAPQGAGFTIPATQFVSRGKLTVRLANWNGLDALGRNVWSQSAPAYITVV